MKTVTFSGETTAHLLHPKSGYHRARTLCGIGARRESSTSDQGSPDCYECLAVLDYARALPKLSEPGSEAYETISTLVWARMDWEIHFRRGLTYELLAIADACAYQERSSLFLAESMHRSVDEFDAEMERSLSNPDAEASDLRAAIAADERTRDPGYSIGYLAEERQIAPPAERDNWVDRGFLYVASGQDKVVHGMQAALVHTDHSVLEGRISGASSYCGLSFKGVLVYGDRPTAVDCPVCAVAARADWDSRFSSADHV